MPEDGFAEDLGLADAGQEDAESAHLSAADGEASRAGAVAAGVKVVLNREDAPEHVTFREWDA